MRANTFGFYSISGNNVINFKEHSKKDDVCEFLEYIRRNNPGKKIILIMDNFRSHWANKPRKKAKDLDISIVFLSPYSPDLNPIEFIWRSIKRRISAIFIESVDHLKTVIREAFFSLASSLSYAKNWINTFLDHEIKRILC